MAIDSDDKISALLEPGRFKFRARLYEGARVHAVTAAGSTPHPQHPSCILPDAGQWAVAEPVDCQFCLRYLEDVAPGLSEQDATLEEIKRLQGNQARMGGKLGFQDKELARLHEANAALVAERDAARGTNALLNATFREILAVQQELVTRLTALEARPVLTGKFLSAAAAEVAMRRIASLEGRARALETWQDRLMGLLKPWGSQTEARLDVLEARLQVVSDGSHSHPASPAPALSRRRFRRSSPGKARFTPA